MSNGLTTSWKIFRLCCIIHLVLVAFLLMLGLRGLFFSVRIIYPITEICCYGVIFFFVYMGLSLLNYNYPETPLTPKQRKQFNWLFLVNFLMIAYLFGQLLSACRGIIPYITLVQGNSSDYLSILTMPVIEVVVFLLHLVFLGGMYQLRRVIYQNTMNSWYNQFEEEKKQ